MSHVSSRLKIHLPSTFDIVSNPAGPLGRGAGGGVGAGAGAWVPVRASPVSSVLWLPLSCRTSSGHVWAQGTCVVPAFHSSAPVCARVSDTVLPGRALTRSCVTQLPNQPLSGLCPSRQCLSDWQALLLCNPY